MTTPPDDPGSRLDRYRNYLRVLAQLHMHQIARRKLDASDVVQQTLVRAVQGWPALQCREPPAVTAWLRKILARTLADAVRDILRGKRDATLEQSLDAALDRSSSALGDLLAADQPTPSQVVAAAEDELRLADALVRLPDAMRAAVVLKHCQGWTLIQIGEHLNRTPAAVASLLRRGLSQLRDLLREGA